MRIRQIKPEFWEDADIAELPMQVRLLFIGLWNMANEYGVLKDDPRWVKRTLFGYDDVTIATIDEWLDLLAGHHQRFIIREAGEIKIRSFEKHQRLSGYEAVKKKQAETVVSATEEAQQPKVEDEPRPKEADEKKVEAQQKHDRSTAEHRNNGVPEYRSDGVPEERKTGEPDTPQPPKGERAGDEYPADFSEFWLAYPRKVNKGQAWKAWQKLKPRPALAVILASVEAHKASRDWQKDGGQFIPHPATWLNARGWEDELGLDIQAAQAVWKIPPLEEPFRWPPREVYRAFSPELKERWAERYQIELQIKDVVPEPFPAEVA